MSRHDGPSGRAVSRRDGRCFLATVLTAVATAVTAGCVTGVPSALKKFQKKQCLAMLFRLTAVKTGDVTGVPSRQPSKGAWFLL